MQNKVQLITYIDRFGGDTIHDLENLLSTTFHDLFGTVHILPFYYPIDGADAGFDPIDHLIVDQRLGDWASIHTLGKTVDIMADVIVNHISIHAPQFLDFSAKGEDSRYAGMFLTLDTVFPDGASEQDLLKVYRPRPGLPLTPVTLKYGQKKLFWTTFTPEQIDIDVTHPVGREYLGHILEVLSKSGVKAIRLDATGYAIKKAGTSCFMIPETFAFIRQFAREAKVLGLEVLVEIHAHYQRQIEIAREVAWVYDFALPPLILHALFDKTAKFLKKWLAVSPKNAITVLDTHDGIGVIDAGPEHPGAPDTGILTPKDIDFLIETIHKNSKGQSQKATGAAASNLDLYQINCTFYDALGRDDRKYLLARLIQFFCPGIPQVYYVGLLAGTNDMDLLASTGVGRDINRSYFTTRDIAQAIQKPVVQDLLRLIRFRNTHPAFDGNFELHSSPDHILNISWENGMSRLKLVIDFERAAFQLDTDRNMSYTAIQTLPG